jgi:hypothetical protein
MTKQISESDGMEIRSNSDWSHEEIEAFLGDAVIPVRLACVTRSGAPLVCSLWFVYRDTQIWCATQRTAAIVRHFGKDSRCAFEIAPEQPPYRGIRGQGRVTLSQQQGGPVLETLVERYLGDSRSAFAQWLLARSDNETAIGIAPTWVTAWDYTDRMNQ